MSRFFVDEKMEPNDLIVITGQDAHHIAKVLRHKPGDRLKLSDGRRTEATGQILEINYKREQIKLKIIDKNIMEGVHPKITLFQGLTKGDKMAFIIQKATEIGVSTIVPVKTERTVVEIEPNKMEAKRQRWQRIAMEAAKQCMRIDIPTVESPQNFNSCLSRIDNFQLALIPWEMERSRNIKRVLSEIKGEITDLAVFIGPEGGFSQDEIQKAKDTRAICMSLGPRILRTETAALAVCCILMYELGDIGGYTCQK